MNPNRYQTGTKNPSSENNGSVKNHHRKRLLEYSEVKKKVIKSHYSLSSYWFPWFFVLAKHSTMTPGLAPSGFPPHHEAAADPFDSETDDFNSLTIQI